MKHLKHILEFTRVSLNEMDEWATSNRLSDYQIYHELTPETIKRSLTEGPPMRVKIKKGTQYYGGRADSSNPMNVTGDIIEARGGVIRVMWDNGLSNSYTIPDLEIA